MHVIMTVPSAARRLGRLVALTMALVLAAGANPGHAMTQGEGTADISQISIIAGVDRAGGVVVPGSYGILFTIEGEGLAGAYSVQTPNGTTVPLLPSASGELRGSLTGFGSLCAISAAIGGLNSFDFSLAGGADTVSLAYSPTCSPEPGSGYADVIFPAHNQTGIDPYPTLIWRCSNGPCPGNSCGDTAWYIELFDPLGFGASYEVDLEPCGRAWTPGGCLTASTQYMFYIAAGSLLAPSGASQTTGADSFYYEAGFEVLNQTVFTTGPSVGSSFCMTAPNSVGDGALICASGSNIAAAADLKLVAGGCPENVPGLFYFGPNQLLGAPFGDGFRCVGVAMSNRMYPFAKAGPMNGNAPGVAMRTVDLAAPYGSSITAGASLNFQYWYRDQMAMMLGFNLTDGVNVVFQ